MKISWGYKILIAYLAFVAGILFLAFKANREKFDLVTENYYAAELKYQDVIDQEQRVAALSEPPKIIHSVNSVTVHFPPEFLHKEIKGEVYLYRPSDASKDIRKKFSTKQAFINLKPEKDLSGSYEVKLFWQEAGKTFHYEQKIFF